MLDGVKCYDERERQIEKCEGKQPWPLEVNFPAITLQKKYVKTHSHQFFLLIACYCSSSCHIFANAAPYKKEFLSLNHVPWDHWVFGFCRSPG
jgi:hypothetical protein